MSCVDWKKMRAEYISSDTSYRKLSVKYGVPRSNIERRAKEEKWTQLRRQAEAKAEAKIIDAVSEKSAKIDDTYFRCVDKLMRKAEALIDNTEIWQPTNLKDMATTMKYLKECKGVKSEADMREQEARIKNLEKQAMESESGASEIHVTFGDASSEDVKEWVE